MHNPAEAPPAPVCKTILRIALALVFFRIISLAALATPAPLFDLTADVRAIQTYGKGTRLSFGDDEPLVITLDKHEKSTPWAGIRIADLPVENLQGQKLEVSYQVKINSLSPIDGEAAHFNTSGWFSEQPGVTRYSERIEPASYRTYFESQQWTHQQVNITVPPDVHYYTLVFVFGHADGIVSLKDIVVRAAPITVTQHHSNTFARTLLVPRRDSVFAPDGLIRIGSPPLEAVARLSFDDEAFYCETKVTDPAPYQPYHDENLWKADSLQVAFDTQWDRSVNQLNPHDDYEFGLAATPKGVLLYPFFQPPDHPTPIGDTSYEVRHDPETQITTYELAIPWRAITSVAYEDLNAFGFNLLVNDSDGEKRSFIQWTPGIGDRKNPADFGILFLDKEDTGFAAGVVGSDADLYGHEDYQFAIFGTGYLETEASISVTLNGQVIDKREITFTPGETELAFTIPAYHFQDGGNLLAARVELIDGTVSEKIVTINHYSAASLMARIDPLTEQVRTKLTQLKKAIDTLGEGPERPLELVVSWQVSDLFINRYIKEDQAEKRFTLALRELQDVDRVLDEALSEIRSGNYHLLPVKPVTDIVYDQGTLTSNGSAVFLSGQVYSSKIQYFTGETKNNLGINYEVISGVTTRYFVPGDPELTIDPSVDLILDVNALRNNSAHNIATSILVLNNQLPLWFGQSFPDAKLKGNHFLDYDPDHPKVREFMAKATACYFEMFARKYPKLIDDIVVWDLSNEPTIETISARTRQNFLEAMKKRYHNIAALNAAWGTDYPDFAATENFPALFPTHPVCRYDWLTFNNQRFFDFWSRTGDIAKSAAPDHQIRTSIKVMNGHSWLPKFRIDNGYDRFLINQMTDAHGGDNEVSDEPDGPYALGWRNQSMSFDLCKSLAPQQPILDNEYHATPSTPEHMRASLWLAAWHGLNAANLWTLSRDKSIWFWQAGEGAQWFKHAQDTMPLVMSIYGRESIRINSVMDRVRHFYEAPRPARILYSQTARIYDGTSSQRVLENAYQALYFQNQSIGFLAESDLLAGNIPNDLQALIIPRTIHVSAQLPDALAQLEQRGVRLILIGSDSLARDEADKLLPPLTLESAIRIDDGTLASLNQSLPDALLQAGIEAPYSLRTANGSAPNHVEARFVNVNGRTIGYAINLGQSPVAFHLVDAKGQALAVRDIFPRVEPTLDEIRLEPMEPINFDVIDTQ